MNRVLDGLPWFFNKHLLILNKLNIYDDPLTVPLHFAIFWVQIHDLPSGLMSENMARKFGNFLGNFLDYDTRIPSMGFQRYMRIKVRLDVQLLLKRKKKVIVGSNSYYAKFMYEKLGLFCFVYGKLGHGKSFCPIRVHVEPQNIVFKWDASLRAGLRGGLMRVIAGCDN